MTLKPIERGRLARLSNPTVTGWLFGSVTVAIWAVWIVTTRQRR